MRDLNEILKRLLQNKVDFVLIGGLAAVTYGVSTTTQDVDVCFSFQSGNIEKLLGALVGIHPKVRAGPKNISLHDYSIERLTQLNNLYIKTDWGELDLLGELAGFGNFDEIKKNSSVIEIFGTPCNILQIDTLIKVKEKMNRPKDIQVLHELKVIRKKL